ncbi:hypothetical protein NU09_2251 [Flavobacterium beibuense]|uniref:Uncharacterized protein n=2 Tax=Flavobacterium beibuense TaxID=657326 RepID=A0A444W975_9FLAO|nr:hypothetical protein NU09_2251 [Flavobacterium beibuense]
MAFFLYKLPFTMKTIAVYVLYPVLLLLNSSTQEASRSCALKEIIQNVKVQKLLHTELEDRKKLYVLKNNFCNDTDTKIGELTVIMIEEDEIKNLKNYFKVTSIISENNLTKINIRYPIQGVCIIADINNQNELIDVNIYYIK